MIVVTVLTFDMLLTMHRDDPLISLPSQKECPPIKKRTLLYPSNRSLGSVINIEITEAHSSM